ncbi:hypothetical protein F5141DRAFT_236550 [Pisolithus sp. B1]|nr:hypothetical protein F5141DRAFT_236550 [Pisolithus sp. B1]
MSTTSTSLRILRVTALLGYMMGSSMLLFARARDGALLLSSILYRINSFTGMPVNTVWFVIVMAGLLGLLVCAGAGAIDAISTSVDYCALRCVCDTHVCPVRIRQ